MSALPKVVPMPERNLDQGYVIACRRAWDHPAFLDYLDGAMWNLIYQKAVWEPEGRDIPFNGRMVHIERGQYITSLRFLAKKFRTSTKVVRGFLDRAQAGHMLVTRGGTHHTLITVCNYNVYQPLDGERAHAGNTTGHSQGTSTNQGNQRNKKERASPSQREREDSGHIDIEEYLAEHPAEEPAPLSDPAFSDEPAAEPEPPRQDLMPANDSGGNVVAIDPRPQKIAEEMREVWNGTCGDQTTMCRAISDKRKSKMVRTFRTLFGNDINRWRQLCQRVAGSPFLCGEGDRGWKADLMWCLEGDHALQIMEGKYDQAHNSASGHSRSGAAGERRGNNAIMGVANRRAARRAHAQEDLLRN